MKLLLIAFFFAIVTIASGIKVNNWNSSYTIKGKLHLPLSDIHEPFTGWYDKVSENTRIDYYDGMVKTFQLPHVTENGTLVKIVPTTTESYLNRDTCFMTKGGPFNKVVKQLVLPNIELFKFIGKDTLLGIKCYKFQLKNIVDEKENVLTLWLKSEENNINYNSNNDSNLIIEKPIPVRYEVRVYNTFMGSHLDYHYMDYEEYQPNIENVTEIFQYSNITQFANCIKMQNSITFNPMQEFIHPISIDHVDEQFTKFINKHGVSYSNESEYEYRKSVFHRNLRFIESKNRDNLSYKLGVNYLADKTEEEIKIMRGYRSDNLDKGNLDINLDGFSQVRITQTDNLDVKIPDQYDWRLYGAVTPVKDQSACGSCWAFAIVGAMEGAYFLKSGGKLVRFSEQALIDCSWGENNFGCDGGMPDQAYKWINRVGGIPTDEEYGPYLGQDGYCHVKNSSLSATIKAFVSLAADENTIKSALLKYGPLVVLIDASQRSFTFYSHGVYYEPNCHSEHKKLNHVVLLVGYGTLGNERYWLIKNSWSTHWGNDGYILMSVRENNCGIMTMPSFAVM